MRRATVLVLTALALVGPSCKEITTQTGTTEYTVRVGASSPIRKATRSSSIKPSSA